MYGAEPVGLCAVVPCGSATAVVFDDASIKPVEVIRSLSAAFTVSIAGTLTYQDVTNVDSIGIVTARNGIDVTGGRKSSGRNSASI